MAEAVGKDLAEAKSLLARATRPNVKRVLASFIKTQTARELELLTGSAPEGEDPAFDAVFARVVDAHKTTDTPAAAAALRTKHVKFVFKLVSAPMIVKKTLQGLGAQQPARSQPRAHNPDSHYETAHAHVAQFTAYS